MLFAEPDPGAIYFDEHGRAYEYEQCAAPSQSTSTNQQTRKSVVGSQSIDFFCHSQSQQQQQQHSIEEAMIVRSLIPG